MMKNIFKTFLIVLVILGSVTVIVKQNDITITNNLNRYNNAKQKFSDEWDYCHMQPDNIIKACLDSSYIGFGHVSDWMVFNKTAWLEHQTSWSTSYGSSTDDLVLLLLIMGLSFFNVILIKIMIPRKIDTIDERSS